MLGIAWPSMRASLDAPFAGLGLLVAGMTVAQFAASAASGLVRERLGTIALLLLSVAAACGGLGLFAIASGWWATILASAVLGCGVGLLDAAVNTEAALRGDIRFMSGLHAAWAIGASLGPPLVGATLVVSDSWRPAYVIAAAACGPCRASVPRRRAFGLRAAPSLSHPAPDRERSRTEGDRIPGRRRDDRCRVPAGGGRSPHAVLRRRHPRPLSCDDGRGSHRAAPRIDASVRGARLRAPGLQVERLRDPGTDESREVADVGVPVTLVERTRAPVGLRDEQNEMPAARRAGIA